MKDRAISINSEASVYTQNNPEFREWDAAEDREWGGF